MHVLFESNFLFLLDDEKNKMLPEGSLDQDGSQAKKHPRNFTYLYFVNSNLHTSVYFVFLFLVQNEEILARHSILC